MAWIFGAYVAGLSSGLAFSALALLIVSRTDMLSADAAQFPDALARDANAEEAGRG